MSLTATLTEKSPYIIGPKSIKLKTQNPAKSYSNPQALRLRSQDPQNSRTKQPREWNPYNISLQGALTLRRWFEGYI